MAPDGGGGVVKDESLYTNHLDPCPGQSGLSVNTSYESESLRVCGTPVGTWPHELSQ